MGLPEVAENGRKSQEQSGDHGGPAAVSPARSRWVRRRLAVKFGQRDRPEVAHLPLRPVYSNSRRWCLVLSDLSRLSNE